MTSQVQTSNVIRRAIKNQNSKNDEKITGEARRENRVSIRNCKLPQVVGKD